MHKLGTVYLCSACHCRDFSHGGQLPFRHAVFPCRLCRVHGGHLQRGYQRPRNLGKPRNFGVPDRSPAHDNGFIAASGLDTRFAIACISTWVCDSFALFGGKWFGKHKLAPKVSPNKTIEGSVTGAVSSMVAGVILYFVFKGTNYNISLVTCVLTGLICSSFGQIGDLAASLIKRMAGLKDYSNLIPGHGGVMDRIDSLLFSIPAAFFCLTNGIF